jgi:hypothetical protein
MRNEHESRHESEKKPSKEESANSDFRIVLRTIHASSPIYQWVRKKELDLGAFEDNTHLLSTFSWRIN